MATILLCGVDLLIRGKLEALFSEHRFLTSDAVEPPDLVIADIARVDAEDVADSYPEIPIVGYTNHTDTAGLRRAHAAGFDRVLAKSALFERSGEVLRALLPSVE
jgi:DNA-binding NarL/FixJ family response regulator